MRIRSVVAILASGVALAGCKGLKDALTAHTDVAASAADLELSATRLGGLLGNARIGIEPSKENAQIIAELWSDYQRLGKAAAHNDSLTANIDQGMTPIFNNMRVSMMIDTMRAKIQPLSPEAAYAAGSGGILSGRHILFKFPDPPNPNQQITPAQKDSVRKFALTILPQITDANFAAMVKKYSGDPGSISTGGVYSNFDRNRMEPSFSAGVAAVKPGEINRSLIETNYGLHVVQRLPYSAVKAEYEQQHFPVIAQGYVDSTVSASLMATGQIEVKPTSSAPIKEAIRNMAAHKDDRTVVATFKGGDMNISQFLSWVNVMPGQMRGQVLQVVPSWPDSQVTLFTRNMAMRQLLLRQADSAKIDVPAAEKANLKVQFSAAVQAAWAQLGLNPKELADSGKTEKDRERIAAVRVDTLISRILNGEAQVVGVITPIKEALDAKWEAEINTAGIDRAVEAAKKARTAADSAKMGASSQVPVPAAPGDSRVGRPLPPPPGTKRP